MPTVHHPVWENVRRTVRDDQVESHQRAGWLLSGRPRVTTSERKIPDNPEANARPLSEFPDYLGD